jgi:hypothetical protein
MSKELLATILTPILKRISELDLSHPISEIMLNQEFSSSHPQLKTAIAQAKQGVEDGWLCDREHAGVKFSRVAKPSKTTFNLSIDAVLMSGEAAAHTHPNGEVSLCIPMQGEPTYDDFEHTWAPYPPGSSHTPTVVGGEMLVLYFLPDGEIDWI